MSGHSKWSSIKHKKAAVDAKRGRAFSKLSRAITAAAKQGGGDPEHNHQLAAAVEKAKDFNMPADKIERAIKRGTGEIEGAQFEQLTYEGYGPNSVAIMVEVLTDNRNRAAADMRNIFARHSGNLGESGCVSWMFESKGIILVNKKNGTNEDDLLALAIEAGADDVGAEDNHWEITIKPEDLMKVRKALEAGNIKFTSAELTKVPKSVVKLDKSQAKKVLRLVDTLEEHDDVQEVYANFDIPDEVLEELSRGRQS